MASNNSNTSGIIIISTFPDENSALKVGRDAVQSKLCACVNLVQVRSIYSWKGRVEDQGEFMAMFKTTKPRVKELKKRIKDLHPYEVPEIVELKMSSVSREYFLWMRESTTTRTTRKTTATT